MVTKERSNQDQFSDQKDPIEVLISEELVLKELISQKKVILSDSEVLTAIRKIRQLQYEIGKMKEKTQLEGADDEKESLGNAFLEITRIKTL